MIRHYKIFFVLLFSSLISAQSVNQITISGLNEFSRSDFLRFTGIATGMPFTESLVDSIKNRTVRNFSERGYHNTVFEEFVVRYSDDSLKVNLDIKISEGPPTYINKIIMEYKDSSLVRDVESMFRFLKGEVLNKFSVENQIAETLTLHENNGYPFIKVVVSSVHLYFDSTDQKYYADIYLLIDPGNASTLDKIEIRGNNTTKDYVILRELRIEPGEIYSQRRIEEFPKRLNRLRFFEPVQTPQYYFNSKNEGILRIDVKERQTNNFDGIIGYIPPRRDDEKGYLTGLINVSLRNLFGTGRAAAVRWHQFDRLSQEMELKYLEPWLLGYPFNINLLFFQRRQDTTYVQRKVEGAIEYLATEDISASVFASSESVIPTERVIPRFTVYNSSSLTTGLSLKIDTRDDPFAPLEGFLFITSYSFSRKKISGPLEYITPQLKTMVNLQRITMSISAFYEMFSKQVIAVAVHGRELRGDQFEESDLFRMGGTNSLRGYREEQFFGSRIVWANLEYRLLLTRRSYAFLFLDNGYFFRDEDVSRNIPVSEGFRTGYGLGLTLETGLGVLGVSFALAKGDSFSDGKIHFGLLNEF